MYVKLDDDNAPMGMGWRYCVVTESRTWMHIYYPPTCTTWRVSKARFAQMRVKPLRSRVDYQPRKVIRLIKEKVAQWESHSLRHSGHAADQALATMRKLSRVHQLDVPALPGVEK